MYSKRRNIWGGKGMKKKKIAITLSTILSLTITSGVSSMTAHAEENEGAP